MIVTEKEATGKACPFAKQFNGHRRSTGPEGAAQDLTVYPMCIGSDCMAWEWEDPDTEYIPQADLDEIIKTLKKSRGPNTTAATDAIMAQDVTTAVTLLGYKRQGSYHYSTRTSWGKPAGPSRRGSCRRMDVYVEISHG